MQQRYKLAGAAAAAAVLTIVLERWRRKRRGWRLEDKVTVVLCTSPVKSNPSTKLIQETYGSMCHYAPCLKACRLIICCDGACPASSLSSAWSFYVFVVARGLLSMASAVLYARCGPARHRRGPARHRRVPAQATKRARNQSTAAARSQQRAAWPTRSSSNASRSLI